MKRLLTWLALAVCTSVAAVAATPNQANINNLQFTGVDSVTGNATAPFVDHTTGGIAVQSVDAGGGATSSGASSVSVTTTPAVVNTQILRFPMTVSIIPQSGVTATAEFSTTPAAAGSPGTANWSVLGTISGVTATNTVTLPSPVTALRFTRISGASAVIGEMNW